MKGLVAPHFFKHLSTYGNGSMNYKSTSLQVCRAFLCTIFSYAEPYQASVLLCINLFEAMFLNFLVYILFLADFPLLETYLASLHIRDLSG